MTDVTTKVVGNDSTSDEVQFVKSRKLSCKQNDPIAEKCSVKRFKKQKHRPKRTKLVKPAVSSVTSDFISSSRRLTRRVGLFSNGKTSTRVSRFEFAASAETKARVEQDLQKILNLACDKHNAVTATDTSQVHISAEVSPQKCPCNHKCSGKVKENTVLSSPIDCGMELSLHQKTSKVFNSSRKNCKIVRTLSTSRTKNSGVTKKFSPNPQPGVELSSVIKRLHVTLNKKCEELFPGVSLRTGLKTELLALQKQLTMSRSEGSPAEVLPHTVSSQTSSSSALEKNYTSPAVEADCTRPAAEADCTKLAAEADFCLQPQTFPQVEDLSGANFKLDFHPESLPYSAPINDWLLSVPTKESFFVNPDKELEEKHSMYYSDVCDNCDIFDGYGLLPSPSFETLPKKYAVLTCASPDSDGQPTWKLQSSPHRPVVVVDSPAASWNYLRCKMY